MKKKKTEQNESMKLRKLACTLPNQLYFQYFILLLFRSPAGSLPFHFFFSSIFLSTHVQSHSLFFVCVFFNLPVTSASSHLTFLHFSLKFLTFSPWLFCFALFFFVRYVCLFHFFLLLLFSFFFLLKFQFYSPNSMSAES